MSDKTFDAFWQRLVSSNKGLDDVETKMTLTVGAFRRQLERAWNEAKQQKPRPSTDSGQHEAAFKDIFGI